MILRCVRHLGLRDPGAAEGDNEIVDVADGDAVHPHPSMITEHAGLVAALGRCFQGAAHQRCRVHFARDLLAMVPKNQMGMVAALFRTIFAQPDAETVAASWEQVRDQFAARSPKVGPYMDDAKAEVLAFAAFPRVHWRKIWSTNPSERLNKEIKRRARVVGIFPNEASLIRLVGMILTDANDEWTRRTPLPLRRIHDAAGTQRG